MTSMHDAIAELVRDGDTVAIEGFTHLICFAAGHEIVRQRRRDLTLARMTPDVIYDQMIAGGVATKLIFSWLGNPGVGSLHSVRRRIEQADPGPLEIEVARRAGVFEEARDEQDVLDPVLHQVVKPAPRTLRAEGRAVRASFGHR